MTRSLRLRLVLGAALWVTAALLAAGWGLTRIFQNHVEEQLVTRLAVTVDTLAARLHVLPDGRLGLDRPLRDPLFHRPLSGLYWQVSSPDGPVLRSRSLWDYTLRAPRDTLEDGAVHRHDVPGPGDKPLILVERQVSLPDLDQPLRVSVAHDASVLQGLVNEFARTLVVSLGILALGLIAAAWAQVAFGLRPLRHLRANLRRIRSGEAEALDKDYPSEVRPLVEDLNALLAHNARMLESARAQAGDLAHALKTPLAIIGTEAESLAARGDSDAAELLSQQVEAMRRQVDRRLAHARAQAAGQSPHLRTPALPSLERLSRVLARVHGTDIHVEADSPPAFKGDQQTLEEILGNLMDNACKWAASRVVVSAGHTGDGRLVLHIDDDGPGVPDARLDTVLQRGRRLDESKPGSGLGLAIVTDLTQASGGTLELGGSPLGGLRATVILPGA